VRLFAKLFLLLTLCASAPLAFVGVTALARSRAMGRALEDSSASTGAQAADAGQEARGCRRSTPSPRSRRSAPTPSAALLSSARSRTRCTGSPPA
jgi:hypothetical protein